MSVVETPRSQGLIARVTNILLRPRAEWDVIAPEAATTQGLILGYAAILAAIPAIAQLVRGLMPHCLFGVVCSTSNPIFVVVSAVLYYVLSLVSVFVMGFIIDALAPGFGGEKNPVQAMKVAVYSWTAAWLAGVFVIVPWIGILLGLSAFYSLYLLYTGLTPLMKSPADKSIVYTLVVVVIAFVVWLVCAAITLPVAAMGALSSNFATGGLVGAPNHVSGTINIPGGSVNLDKLQAAAQQMKDAAQASQDGKALPAIDPNVLKGMLPDSIAGAPRTEISAVSAGAAGLGGSDAEATYQNGDVHITLKVADIAAARGFASMAGALNVQEDKETSTGYEKVQTINGRLTTEKYDNQDKSGEYSIIVGGRFVVSADGSGVPIDTLKAAVAAVNPDRLESLAKS